LGSSFISCVGISAWLRRYGKGLCWRTSNSASVGTNHSRAHGGERHAWVEFRREPLSHFLIRNARQKLVNQVEVLLADRIGSPAVTAPLIRTRRPAGRVASFDRLLAARAPVCGSSISAAEPECTRALQFQGQLSSCCLPGAAVRRVPAVQDARFVA
jgi:hypothetical protein